MVAPSAKPCKKKKSTMLTVEQMVDVALGAPEIGAVNFNVLHALIHVIVQQLNIQKCLVEFKGYDSERMDGIILSAKPGPILKLSEYMIDSTDGKPHPGKEKSNKLDESEEDAKEVAKKPFCECTVKKKKEARENEDREKSDRGKDESEGEEKRVSEKRIRREPPQEECEDVEEPEHKKVRDVRDKKGSSQAEKTKPCQCKAGAREPEMTTEEALKAMTTSYYGSDSEGACQTIVRVEPVGKKCDGWRSRPALAHDSMVKLEAKVAMLQDAFEALERMPTNEELKKRASQGVPSTTPVKDLWQLYNLSKRVEGCEGTIEKLASMIEDIVKETCNFREAMLVIADAVDEIECANQMSRTSRCAALQGFAAPTKTGPAGPPQKSAAGAAAATTGISTKKSGTEVQDKSAEGCKDDEPCEEGQAKPAGKPSETEGGVPAAEEPQETAEGAREIGREQTREREQDQDQAQAASTAQGAAYGGPRGKRSVQNQGQAPGEFGMEVDVRTLRPNGLGPEFFKMNSNEKFCVLKEHVDCLLDSVSHITRSFPVNQLATKLCALVSMQKQLDALEGEWKSFLQTFGDEGVSGLSNNVKNLKSDTDTLGNLMSRLMSEKQETDGLVKLILQEIESMKKVKADLEVVEDLLAEKADAAVVNRKVSHDQFDAACDDLTRGLDEALEKLLQQEALWNDAMDELQKDLDNKLDKSEIMPLKEFINKKLKCLQEKLKQLAQLRKDAEAAGAKTRILRNLNCIACDGDVVMKMDNVSSYQCPALPATKSIKPMLTYELDQVRKAARKGVPCRAMLHPDDAVADAQRKPAPAPLAARETIDNKISRLAHLCNRYCGGSHTITTPQQRVTRIGHFLTEFGPQALALFNLDSKPTQGRTTSLAPCSQEADFRKPT